MLVKLITTMAVLIFLDSIFFYVNQDLLYKQIVKIQGKMTFDLFAGLLCYVALAFGINHFILKEKKSLVDAFLLGVVINAVYETTNKAFLEKWSYTTVVIDVTWGGILFALTTLIMRRLYKF